MVAILRKKTATLIAVLRKDNHILAGPEHETCYFEEPSQELQRNQNSTQSIQHTSRNYKLLVSSHLITYQNSTLSIQHTFRNYKLPVPNHLITHQNGRYTPHDSSMRDLRHCHRDQISFCSAYLQA